MYSAAAVSFVFYDKLVGSEFALSKLSGFVDTPKDYGTHPRDRSFTHTGCKSFVSRKQPISQLILLL